MYNTEEELTTYYTTRLNTGVWTNANESDKLAANTMAGKRIDMLSFIGTRTATTQEHEFPRNDETDIPTIIKEAHAEIVLKFLQGYDSEESANEVTAKKRTFSGVSTTYDTDTPRPWLTTGVMSKTAWELMLPWLSDSTSVRIVNGIQGN